MRSAEVVMAFTALMYAKVGAFAPHWKRSFSSNRMALTALPTIEQLSKDPFMKQVSHASEIVPLLSMEENEELSAMLQAQLSHSDGIRGFFVNYLTGEGYTAADAAGVPPPLMSAIKTVSDRKDLISLACMNVIMPTAMSTMHTDGSLQQSSAKTAQRGIKVLNYLATLSPEEVKHFCEAITAAAARDDESDDDDAKVLYWTKFFANYGYEAQQRQDILSAIGSINC